MASTSTSHSVATKLLLRLTDARSGSSQAFSLHSYKEAATFEMEGEGAVQENYAYYVDLLSEADLGLVTLAISVNGGDSKRFATIRPASAATWKGRPYWYYRCDFGNEGRRLFKSSYGFAVIKIDVLFGDGRPQWTLFTKDIPCICPYQNQERAVSGMIDAIASAKGSFAAKWMFSGIIPDNPSSALVDGGTVANSSLSLAGYLDFVDRVVNAYEEGLPFFHVRAHSRTLKTDQVVDATRARKLGRRELMWMSRNAELLHRVNRSTGIRLGGDYYMATEVQTERSVKSFDNDENRAVLSFIKEVSASLKPVSDRIELEVARLQNMDNRLSTINSGSGMLLSRIIVEACLKREVPLAKKAVILRRRCQGLVMAYERALPGVASVRYKKPRRSKVFQEVKAYADLFSLMRVWPQFEGFDLVRDGLLLHTFKMDKLYEYFALLRMLEWLEKAGFREDGNFSTPVQSVRYTLEDWRFSNEKQVANLYRLSRGDLKLALYFQPVIYGDAREENGVTLHRSVSTTPFSPGGNDSFLTPDFLIVLEGGGAKGKRHVILDAKFRPVDALAWDERGGAGEFKDYAFKYKTCIAAAGRDRVDALWLLCGKTTEPKAFLFQETSWASSGELMLKDGIAALYPGGDSLDEMFAAIGVQTAASEEEAVGENRSGSTKQALLADGAEASNVEEDTLPKAEPSAGDGGVVEDSRHDRTDALRIDKENAAALDAIGEDAESGHAAVIDDGVPHLTEPMLEENVAREPEPEVSQNVKLEGGSLNEAAAGAVDSLSLRESRDPILPVAKSDAFSIGGIQTESAPASSGGKNATSEAPVRKAKVKASKKKKDTSSCASIKKKGSGLSDEVSFLVERICELTIDKDAFFDPTSAQMNFGFQHPLLRKALPVGREAKLYTKGKMKVAGGEYHVYSSWTPLNVQKLKNAVKAAEKDLVKAQTIHAGGSESRSSEVAPVSGSPSSLPASAFGANVDAAKTDRTDRNFAMDASAAEVVSESASGPAQREDGFAIQPFEGEQVPAVAEKMDEAEEKLRKARLTTESSPISETDLIRQRVASEWYKERNQGTRFEDYSLDEGASGAPAWWQGECGHKWREGLGERIASPLCPVCHEGLKSVDPEMARLFHRAKNGNALLKEIANGNAERRCWWKCPLGHEWTESPEQLRTRDCKCPECEKAGQPGAKATPY